MWQPAQHCQLSTGDSSGLQLACLLTSLPASWPLPGALALSSSPTLLYITGPFILCPLGSILLSDVNSASALVWARRASRGGGIHSGRRLWWMPESSHAACGRKLWWVCGRKEDEPGDDGAWARCRCGME